MTPTCSCVAACAALVAGQEGHTYCRECITEWLSRSEVCPVDRQRLTTASLCRVRMAERLIEKLEIMCTHQPECTWTGALSARSVHLGKDCEHEEVDCSLNGCTENVKRQALATHEASCEHRIVSCRHCSTEMPAHTLEEHYTVCSFVEVACPRSCGEHMPRGIVGGHEDTCPRMLIDCRHTGCTVRVERRAMPAHAAECEHRIVQCQHCSTEMPAHTLEEHCTMCTMVEVDCPRSCGAAVPRGEIDGHEDSCPLMPMPCPFAPHGCRSNVLRQGYSAHQVECAVEHAELVAARVEKLSAVLSTTVSALEVQAGKVQELEGTVEELEARVGEPSAMPTQFASVVGLEPSAAVEELEGTVDGLAGVVKELKGTVERLEEQLGATATVEWQAQGAQEKIAGAPELDNDRTYLYSADFTVGPVLGRGTYTLSLRLDFSQEKGVGLFLYHRGGGVDGEPLQIRGTVCSIGPCPAGGAGTSVDTWIGPRSGGEQGSRSGASTFTESFTAGEHRRPAPSITPLIHITSQF